VIEGEKLKENIFRVSNMVEKPKLAEAPSNMAIIGRYILTPDIFDILEKTPPGKGGEVQLTDALLQQAQEGAVLAYRFKGTRYDCGSVEGYIDATQYVYEHIYRKPKA
jgi:UTP--glucose-1-phosphate uridylyltransferase